MYNNHKQVANNPIIPQNATDSCQLALNKEYRYIVKNEDPNAPVTNPVINNRVFFVFCDGGVYLDSIALWYINSKPNPDAAQNRTINKRG